MTETTLDGFLDGRLQIRQPRRGYRAGMDPVLLAAAVDAKRGESVLELGCGVGVALFCLGHRVSELSLTGLEFQPELAELARMNAVENGLDARIVTGDAGDMPEKLRAESFDHVLANPPFFQRTRGSLATDPSREVGRGEQLPLAAWVDAGVRRLKPGGRLWLIHRADRLPEVLSALDDRVGTVRVLPLCARVGRDPETVIITAKKGSRGAFRLLSAFVRHEGSTHEDGDCHTPLARAILRGGSPLPMDDSA